MSCKGTMKWLGGFFTGAAIGAAAGLLFAPKSGEETRAEINDGIQERFYDAYDAVLNLGDRLSDQIEDLKADFSEWSEKVKDGNAINLDDEEGYDPEENDAVQIAEDEPESTEDNGSVKTEDFEVMVGADDQTTEDESVLSEDEDVPEVEFSEKIKKEELTEE